MKLTKKAMNESLKDKLAKKRRKREEIAKNDGRNEEDEERNG